jgi:hypothetical protein
MATSPKFEWAGKAHSLLSETTAMASWSWSLPAEFTCPGMVARDENDICFGCYAQIGCYGYRTTAEAQAARLAWTKECSKTANGRKHWIDTMVHAIRKCATNGYFRWHDSGDVFNAKYACMIGAVVRLTPDVKHWLPTRSWRLPWGLPALRALHALPNMVVRPSALSFGDSPPKIEGLGKGSTAHLDGQPVPKGARECPKAAKENENKSCAEANCRLCWQNRSGASYLVHGRRGLQKVHHCTDKERAFRLDIVKLKMSYSG